MPPGTRALAFASRWFDPRTVNGTFTPLIADWQREWLSAERSRRGKVWLRGAIAFVIAILVSSPQIFATHTPPATMRRVVMRIVLFAAIADVVLTIPFILDTPGFTIFMFLALSPSALVLALPFALIPAVDVIQRDPTAASHVARASVLKLALAGSLCIAIGHGFIVPIANQQFRILATQSSMPTAHGRSVPQPGIRETSTVKLLADAQRLGPALRYTQAGVIRRELNARAVLAVLPALLVWLRWLSLDTRSRRRPSALALTPLLFVGFFAASTLSIPIEYTWNLTPGTGLWMPVLIGILIGGRAQLAMSRRQAV